MIRGVLMALCLTTFVVAQILSAWLGAYAFAVGVEPDWPMIYAIIIAQVVGGGVLMVAGAIVAQGRRDRVANAVAGGAILGAVLTLLSGAGGRHGR